MAELAIYFPERYETELERYLNSYGTYEMDLMDQTESKVPGAEFYFANASFVKAYTYNGTDTYEELGRQVFFYRPPGVIQISGKYGQYAMYTQDHPLNAPMLFRSMVIPMVVGTENIPSVGRVLEVDIDAINHYWVNISGNRIVKMSPAIEKAITKWKGEDPGRELRNIDFLGATPYASATWGFGVTQYEVNLVNKTVVGNPENGTYTIGVHVDHPTIANPLIKSLSDRQLVNNRGGKQFRGIATPAAEPILQANLVYIDRSFMRGVSSQKGWYVSVYSPELGLQATTPTNPMDGGWIYRYPDDVRQWLNDNNVDMEQFKTNLKILLHQYSNPTQQDLATLEMDPDTILVKGVPELLQYGGSDRFDKGNINPQGYLIPDEAVGRRVLTGASNNRGYTHTNAKFFKYTRSHYENRSVSDVPLIDFLKTTGANQETTDKMFLYLYLGTSDPDHRKYFMSVPGSVLNAAGIDIFYKGYERGAESAPFANTDRFYANREKIASLGGEIYGFVNKEELFTTSWRKETSLWIEENYKVEWTRNKPFDEDEYRFQWISNYEPRHYEDSYKVRYSKELSRSFEDDYTIRWHEDLPEEDEDALFFDFSWTIEATQEIDEAYHLKWTKEATKIKEEEYSIKWTSPAGELVLVKPYYIQEGKRHHISYMVYGSPKVAQYLIDDSLTFYFSNPTKYELIKFNYNAEPYKGIFMEEINSPVLDDLIGIPPDYTLIGNYTIKDINVSNSLSLDVVAKGIQLNEFRSYWLPEDMSELGPKLKDMGSGRMGVLLDPMFKDDHHVDVVELEIEFLEGGECCFTQKTVGTRCSPY